MKKIGLLFIGFFLFLFIPSHARTVHDTGQRTLQTAIKITAPHSGTVWMAPSQVKIEWNTENIPENKTIQFYLVKDDMVVQELGIFQNNKFVDQVPLGRGLSEANNYRVIGIELFPDDKYSIAKFTTDFFTIRKAPREEKTISKIAEHKVVENKAVENNVVEIKAAAPIVRKAFDGRKLNYINEIKVSSSNIKINLRDHGRVDGDIVSIYLNGEAIVSKYLLTYRNKTFEVQLDPTKPNDLFLYAHNLGTSPPNTVAIEIKDGRSSEKIILNSDLKSCEAVMIKVGE